MPEVTVAANETVINLHWLDWAVISIYGAICFGIAFWAMRQIKDTGGLLVGKRNMGKLMMMAASFAGGTNANHPMSVAAAAHSKGMPGIWLSLTWMLITPFFWIYPPAIRRLRIVTLVDAVRMRFGHFMAFMFKAMNVITGPLVMGLGLKSAAIVIDLMTGGFVNELVGGTLGITDPEKQQFWTEFIVIGMIAVPTLIYSLMGGVIAAYATDVLQGLMIVVLSFLLIPFAIYEAGGLAPMNAAIDDEMASLFSGVGNDFGFWWIFWFAIACMFAASTSAAGGAAAARSEFDSRMKLFGLIAKRFCTVGWGLVGVVCLGVPAIAAHVAVDPAMGGSVDNVFAVASGSLLPTVLRGLMVASILAAVMSSLDAGILNYGGIIVNNFYQEYIVKDASAKHYLLMTRLFAALGLLIGWYVATVDIDLVEFTTIVEPLGAITGIAILFAIFWRGLTGAGAVASVFVVGPLFLACNRPEWSIPGTDLVLFELLNLRGLAELLIGWYGLDVSTMINPETGLITSLPVQVKYPMFLLPTIFVMVVVSIFTKHHNQRAVDEFYCRLDTPVGDEHKIREAGFEVDQLDRLKSEVVVSESARKSREERLLLVDWLRLPKLLKDGEVKLSDYRIDLIGIAGSIVFIFAFLAGLHYFGIWLFA